MWPVCQFVYNSCFSISALLCSLSTYVPGSETAAISWWRWSKSFHSLAVLLWPLVRVCVCVCCVCGVCVVPCLWASLIMALPQKEQTKMYEKVLCCSNFYCGETVDWPALTCMCAFLFTTVCMYSMYERGERGRFSSAGPPSWISREVVSLTWQERIQETWQQSTRSEKIFSVYKLLIDWA